MSGAVSSEPLDASGLAPSISRCIVRSTSGIGTVSAVPNSSAEEISLGRWSTVLAEKMLLLPSALSSTRP
jgi:hypothetical protein